MQDTLNLDSKCREIHELRERDVLRDTGLYTIYTYFFSDTLESDTCKNRFCFDSVEALLNL